MYTGNSRQSSRVRNPRAPHPLNTSLNCQIPFKYCQPWQNFLWYIEWISIQLDSLILWYIVTVHALIKAVVLDVTHPHVGDELWRGRCQQGLQSRQYQITRKLQKCQLGLMQNFLRPGVVQVCMHTRKFSCSLKLHSDNLVLPSDDPYP